jgi:hypothetical protein
MKPEKSIFQLTQISYSDYSTPKYPSFEVERFNVGYFSSLAKAEQEMKKLVKEDPKYIFGFLVNEYPLDCRSWNYAKSRRNYLSDGALWDESLVSEIEKDGVFEEFLGRPANKMRFNIGDFVEVLYGNTVELEIVANQPCTPESCDKMKKRSEAMGYSCFRLDSSDDSYYTLDQTGEHAHPNAVTLFPARLRVSNKLKMKLLSDYAIKKYFFITIIINLSLLFD